MAGTDQGTARRATEIEMVNAPRVYLTGLLYGKGLGCPTQSGILTAYVLGLDGVEAPGYTSRPRPALSRPAGINQGVARPVTESDKASGAIDWFEKIHILPRVKIEFGNIITQVENTYEIYSAYRTTSQTLSAIVNNATPGVALPDESTPETADAQASMLDASSTDNTGDSFVLGNLVKRSILALTDGLPIFDKSVIFNFATANDVRLLVSGERIVFVPLEYEAPVRESLAFLTDVIPSVNGKEQRIALRKQPRQMFDVMYKLDGNDRQRMQALLMDWQANVFGFPVWQESLKTTADVSAGATTYTVADTTEVDLRVGGLAVVFTDANTYDVLTISSITSTTIASEDASVNAYAAGTTIMPLRTATMVGAVAGIRYANNLEEFRVKYEVTDNDTGALTGSVSAYSSYNGRVMFDDCNVVSGDRMAEEYKKRIYRIDNSTGNVSQTSSWDVGKRSHQKGFVMRSREEVLNFRKAMLSLGGRLTSFYIPTFIEDLEVVANLIIGATTMDIRRIEYQRFIQSRLPKKIFRITFTDGTSLVRVVDSAASVNATTERLTLDSTWPAGRTTSEITRVQFYELVRFDADTVPINHPRNGLASATMPVTQVLDDN